jgi:hypothetical protein
MSEKKDLGYYAQCVSKDIIGLAKPLLERAGYKMRWGDGKFHADLSMTHETPWVHVKHDGTLDCHTWHALMFDVIFKVAGEKFVPAECQQCWKVVARPQTLLGLFAIGEIQTRMNRPSKHGIELRETVHGLYGAYWYNHSLEEGRECYRMVRQAVDAEPLLGPDTPVLLKRACTEYEMECGPSDEWEVTEQQKNIEDLVNNTFVRDPVAQPQPDHMIRRIHRRWIEFAYAAGDETYKHFTNGHPVHPPYVTYHEDIEKELRGDNDNDPEPEAEGKPPKSKPPGAKPTNGKRKK